MKIVWLLAGLAVVVLLIARARSRPEYKVRLAAGIAEDDRKRRVRQAIKEVHLSAGPAATAPFQTAFPLELHRRGDPEQTPFGEDLQCPDSRVIPAVFHGVWKWEGADQLPTTDERRLARDRIEASEVDMDGHLEPVIAVRFIDDREIAVVTQQMDGSTWAYALRYFGLSRDGTVMTNLESADWRWLRV